MCAREDPVSVKCRNGELMNLKKDLGWFGGPAAALQRISAHVHGERHPGARFRMILSQSITLLSEAGASRR